MKQPLIAVLVSGLLLVGCEQPAPSSQIEPPVDTPGEEASQLTVPIEEPEPSETSASKSIPGADSPLSLQSFFDQEFAGSEFTIGRLLQDHGTHKRYYATYRSNGLLISGTWHVPTGEGPFPVLILNHGYFPIETYYNGYGFGREQRYFAKHGYAVLHIDYRNHAYSDTDPTSLTSGQHFGYTGYSSDAVNAVLALQAAELPYLDMNRVGMFGHSMGGGVTLNALAAQPDLIQAAVMWGSVSSDYEDNFNQWTRERISAEKITEFENAFGSIDESASFAALSVRSYLDRIQTPLLIQHGTADEDVPVAWSETTYRELSALEKAVEYIAYEGAPHVFWLADWDRAMADTHAFFDRYLQP